MGHDYRILITTTLVVFIMQVRKHSQAQANASTMTYNTPGKMEQGHEMNAQWGAPQQPIGTQ
jgi:hypothetical protein